MSTPSWDISTGVYASKSLSVSAQDLTTMDVTFSPDGMKAYTVGYTNDYVYQYTLTVAWDISTGSYAYKTMYVGTQDTAPYGMTFSSDGMKCYIMGNGNNTVFQYTLSVAWDISTGSYASKSMSVAAQETICYGLAFSSDGTKCYICGAINSTVFQYTLSAAWDISTGSYASKSLSVSTQEATSDGVVFSPDGTKCYVVGYTTDAIYQYTLSVAWDVSTGSYASKSMSVLTQDNSPYGIALSGDGAEVYMVGSANVVYQYDLGVIYGLTGTIEDPTGTAIANAEVKIFQTTGAAWDISGGSYASKSMSVSSQTTTPYGTAFSSDGTKAYVTGGNTVYQYTLSTAWDVSTGSYALKSLSVSTQESATKDVAFSSDGTKCYIIGTTNNTVFQYTLSTAWDVSTGSYASKSMSVATQETAARAVAFSSDGTKCYIIGNTNNTVYQYTLSTAWDVSTGSYASKSMSVATQDASPFSVAFSSDGTKAYMVGWNADTVFQYTLSTAWDVSTGSYASKSMSTTAEGGLTSGISLSTDGLIAYVVKYSAAAVYQYSLAPTTILKDSLTADASGVFIYTSGAVVETNLQVVGTSAGPPRRFGATDNNLSTS